MKRSLLIRCLTGTFCLLFLVTTDIRAQQKSIDTTIYEKVEIEASFPGGNEAWAKHLTEAISAEVNKFKNSDYGTVYIKFIVNTKGQVSEVEATNMKRSRLAKVAVQAIENGPRWNPAVQDGRKVNAYRIQPVTLKEPAKKKK